MRKFICCTMLLASAFSFIGCQEELTNNVPDGKPLTSFTAIAEDINTDTKTTMSYKYDILWNEGDLITITDEDGAWDEFILVAGEGTAKGTFRQNNATECEVWENDVVRAYYPANIAEVDYGVETILTWPSKQTASQTMLMYSEISLGDRQNEQINFKNLGAMMQVVVNSVTPDVVLKYIKIQDGTKPLSGTFTIGNNDNAVITASGNAGITLDLGTGTSLGKSAKFFNICVPPGTYSDLTFTFTAMDGATFVKDVPSLTFDRNTVYKITLSSEFTHEAVQLWEDGPFWATTNIGAASPEEYGWYFSWGNTVGYVYNGYNWKNALTGAAFSGFTDGNYSSTPGASAESPLDAAHDPAAVIWGGDWRTPTTAECNLICQKADIAFTDNYNGIGIKGFIVTGRGDYSANSIFLPCSGLGRSAGLQNVDRNVTLNVSESDMAFVCSTMTGNAPTTSNNYYGRPVRAVYSAPVPVEGISIAGPEEPVKMGHPVTLTATITPENASNKSIKWLSTKTSVATVDQYGVVTPVAPGTTDIVAIALDGDIAATCPIEVIAWTDVTGVSLTPTSLNMIVGHNYTLTASVLPSGASDKQVTWTSSNESAATVSNGTVTAIAPGTATITAETNDGNFTATCNVTVNGYVTSVSLGVNKITDLLEGDYGSNWAIVSPTTAPDKSVTWSSSNPFYVTVDEEGNVRAIHGDGSAVITATTTDGGHTASYTVTTKAREFVHLWKDGPYFATVNVGAKDPQGTGFYFDWGNTEYHKIDYMNWYNNNTYVNDFVFGKSTYVNTRGGEYAYPTAQDISDDISYDAARATWCGWWRMPTKSELEGLVENCDWEWQEGTVGVSEGEFVVSAGYLVKGRGNYAGEEIFLPAAGYAGPYVLAKSTGASNEMNDLGSKGYYWSATNYDWEWAWHFQIYNGLHDVRGDYRHLGFVIRAVHD